MAKVKYITSKGAGLPGSKTFYIGIAQHERSMPTKETYEYCSEKIGFKPTMIRAAFLGLKSFIKSNSANGNGLTMSGIVSIRNTCRGAFASMRGPFVKGKNMLMVNAVELDPFKSALKGLTLENNTKGVTPSITSVLDDVSGEYDVIEGTHEFSIAGAELNPDMGEADEYVAFLDSKGVETKAEVTYSDLQNVKAHLISPLAAGNYTLVVNTRSGLGESFGVKTATRKITIK